MNERFQGLKKAPKDPAAKILSQANVRLKTQIDAPPTAPCEVVLAEMES